MMETDELIKCINLQADILQLAEEGGYLAAIELTAYPMTLSLHEDTGQMSLFESDDRPGTCCISCRDNALEIETGGEFSMPEARFIKILHKFKKCCQEYAFAAHRERYEGYVPEKKKAQE